MKNARTVPNLPTIEILFFDCDGVVLDSNRLKTEAFNTAELPYGKNAAQALVDHHIANGGISHYVKLAHFLDHIVPEYAEVETGPSLEDLLAAYANAVRAGFMTCSVADGLVELRAATPQARWMIVSGGDQAELRAVFAAREIAEYFDAGIFGSPDTKDTILSRELATGNLQSPALFLGDSRLDYEVAGRAGLDFVFISGWSEWTEGAKLAGTGAFPMVTYLADVQEREDGDQS